MTESPSSSSLLSDDRLAVRCLDVHAVGSLGGAAGGPVTVVGVPVLQGPSGPVLADGVPPELTVASHRISSALPTGPVTRHGFAGKKGEILELNGVDGPALVYLGCGPAESLSIDSLRLACAALVRTAGRSGQAMFVLPAEMLSHLPTAPAGRQPLPPAARRAAQALSEGAVLASYRFTAHKSAHGDQRIDALVVTGVGIEPEVLSEGVRRGTVVAEAVCFARDLVNEPPSTMNPRRLAAAAESYLSGRNGVTFEMWDEERIEAERLGGLLAVARGSAEPPRLLRADFEPPDPVEVDGRVPHVVLVGKGITFDSGGLSLKPAEGMMTMKTDMSGAAAVLAALGVCGELGVRVRVTAIAPATENMPGGRAQKPGDVLTARNGKTIEVLNTDAEGRLVLADGLSLAAEMSPDAIVDLATLTGAQVVALGSSIAAVFANQEVLADRLVEAADRAGERIWPLPLAQEYRSHIDSEVADMKNIGKGGQAGSISAALLLERFVDDTPWAHLDIAGPARSEDDSGVLTKGGTGFGVRTLLEFLERFGAEPLPRRAPDQA